MPVCHRAWSCPRELTRERAQRNASRGRHGERGPSAHGPQGGQGGTADLPPTRSPRQRGAAGGGARAGAHEEKRRSGPVSRVLSPPLSERAMNIHLGPWLPRGLISEQPERMGRAIPVPQTAGTRSYWLLLQVGFTVPSESPQTRCALTAPFHPYPPLSERAVCFLWHFPASRLDWPLASTLPYGARTFLPPPVTAVTGVHPDHSGTCPLQQPRDSGPLQGTRRAWRTTSARRWPGCSSHPPARSSRGGCGGASPWRRVPGAAAPPRRGA